jgi:hypothetical protein
MKTKTWQERKVDMQKQDKKESYAIFYTCFALFAAILAVKYFTL